MKLIRRIVHNIGQPTQLESDPRAGLGAVWGSRETGALTVSRAPVPGSPYEVMLLPRPFSTLDLRQSLVPPSPDQTFFKGELMSDKDLSGWFEANVATIQRVLSGE